MSKIYIFLSLIILGLLGNILNIEMFFGVNQIFGSIFVLLAAWYFGPLLGVLAAVIVHSYTIYLWGHPYAFISFTFEALVVGLLLRKKISNIFIADALYWSFLGVWLVPLFYGDIMGLGDTQVTLIMLKQVVNGVLNALVATLISIVVIHYINTTQKINFRDVLFSIMITIVAFSLYISANIMTKNTFKNTETRIIQHLQNHGKHLEQEITTFMQTNSIEKINSHKFQELLQRQSFLRDMEILIIKNNKIILSSNNESKITKLTGIKNILNKHLYHLLPDKKIPKMLKWKKSFYIYELQGNYLGSYTIAITQSFGKYIDELQEIYIFTFILLLFVIGISAIIIYFISLIILRPIVELLQNSYDLPDKIINNKEIIWPQSNIKEIMGLSHNFSILTDTLKNIFLENNERYEKIFNGSQDSILVINLKTQTINNYNHSALEVFGKDLLENQSINHLIPNANNLLNDRSNNNDIIWLKDKNNRAFGAKVDTQYVNLNNEDIVLLSIKDITKELEAQDQLQLISKVFETTQEGIIITDASKSIVMVNKSFTTITGYQENEVIGKNPKFLSSKWHDNRFYQEMWNEIESTNKFECEIQNRRKNGELYTEWLTIYKLKDTKAKTINYIAIFADISDKQEAKQKIHQLAYYDILTSLPNRSLFEDRMQHALSNAKRSDQTVALMFIDLDNFKIINDTLGHNSGDILLRDVALRIKSTLRDNDTLSRIGGDEFTLILEDVQDKTYITTVAKKIIASLTKPFKLNNKEAFTGASIGICLYPDDADSVSGMMRKADTAMYRVKELGKNSFEFFTESMNKDVAEELEMISELKKALDNNVLELHYQPQVSLKTAKITGAEALIRWRDPIKGFISPELFIPIAEKSGLMGAIEKFVLNTGAAQQALWQSMGINIQLSLNISHQHFSKNDFAQITSDIFKENKVKPSTIGLELTERIVMGSDESLNKIKTLKDLGFEIALDDFGTGQSSLSYLKKYDIDELKIDKSFIDDLPDDKQSCSIVKAIISLGDALDMKTVAEGVEKKEQLEFLHELGCNIYQGWFFSKALKAKEFEKLYHATNFTKPPTT